MTADRIRVVGKEPCDDGRPWWTYDDAGPLVEEIGFYTPYGIMIVDEIFDRHGRSVESFALAVTFEGMVVAGPEEGIWLEGPVALLQHRVRLQ